MDTVRSSAVFYLSGGKHETMSLARVGPFPSAFRCCVLVIVALVIQCLGTASACTDLELAEHSQWRVESHNSVLWLLTPCGERFFSIGINVLDGGFPTRIAEGRLAYHWGTFYPDLNAWGHVTRTRVLDWGFNTAGGWSLHPAIIRLAVIPNLELGRLSSFHWFDPLHPSAEERMRTKARELVVPYKGNPYRIGYFSDNEVGWWNGALFTYYMKQPPTNYTKQRLLALLRAHYGDDWERFTHDFVPPHGLSSFEHLLHSKGVFPQLRPGGAGIHVVRQWTGIVAEHYYRLMSRTLRDADPQALIFGDRLPIYYDPVAVRAMAPYVDAIATNYNVDSPDGWIARYYFDGLRELTGHKPILISEWFFAAHENRTGNRNNTHLMTVQTQGERARGAAAAAERFAQDPAIIGIHWFQYYDHPRGGRPADGEDHNFGLVDIDDRPYEELVEALSRANHRLAAIHQRAQPPVLRAPTTPREIPRADISPHDLSLAEWPKEQAFVPGLVAPGSETVFGDFYVAWNRMGLHLATISMDYYDPVLLAYDETFPFEEAFRIDWGIDAGAGPQRFALYVIPPKALAQNHAPQMRAQLCRADMPPCVPIAGAIVTYFGSDQSRITVEVSLPWQALGLSEPPARRELQMSLAATTWHRSRWMSISGQPPAEAMQDPAQWSVVTLGNAARPRRP
jgi:hypothetical protein